VTQDARRVVLDARPARTDMRHIIAVLVIAALAGCASPISPSG